MWQVVFGCICQRCTGSSTVQMCEEWKGFRQPLDIKSGWLSSLSSQSSRDVTDCCLQGVPYWSIICEQVPITSSIGCFYVRDCLCTHGTLLIMSACIQLLMLCASSLSARAHLHVHTLCSIANSLIQDNMAVVLCCDYIAYVKESDKKKPDSESQGQTLALPSINSSLLEHSKCYTHGPQRSRI